MVEIGNGKGFWLDFERLSIDPYLRADEKFHKFLHSFNWNLFDSTDNQLIPLNNILEDDYEPFDYQEGQSYKGVPTGQSYVDEDGDIIDFQLVTLNNHPGRLSYKVSNENILISSLRLAKSPALFFENEDLSGYVFSNGFYIFRVKSDWNRKFILYVLRTKKLKNVLDNHIYRGIAISTFRKEDLLKIKIPLITNSQQTQIVAQIAPIEKNIRRLKAQIASPQAGINKVFADAFEFDLEKFERAKKQTFFEADFTMIANDRPLKASFTTLKSAMEQDTLKLDVPYLKIENLAEDIVVGGDKPSVFSEYETDACKYPVYSNGKEKDGLFGFTNEYRVKSPCVTISARGTVGFSVARDELFFPIVRLITVITDSKKVLNQYLEHALNFINIQQSGNTIAQLTAPMVKEIEVPVPDLQTQQEIVDEIKAELDKQEALKQQIQIERDKIDRIIEAAIQK